MLHVMVVPRVWWLHLSHKIKNSQQYYKKIKKYKTNAWNENYRALKVKIKTTIDWIYQKYVRDVNTTLNMILKNSGDAFIMKVKHSNSLKFYEYRWPDFSLGKKNSDNAGCELSRILNGQNYFLITRNSANIGLVQFLQMSLILRLKIKKKITCDSVLSFLIWNFKLVFIEPYFF